MTLTRPFLVLLFVLGAGPAFAHAHLNSATPDAGSVVAASPPEIVLQFTEPLERAFSGIEVNDSTGKRVGAGTAQVKDLTMRVTLPQLSPGLYTVKWHVLSVDTHKSDGTFTFTVKP